MNIAILTSGILPVPAVRGGAVETLIDSYLEYNEQHKLHNITVYSVNDKLIKKSTALRSTVNRYYYIDVQSVYAKICKKLYHFIHGKEYYHYTIEYYFHKAIQDIKKQHYDIIIFENRPAFSLKLPRNINSKIIYHIHNDFLNAHISYAQDIYNKADRIITVSNYIASCIKTINPQDTKCVTVHNGINIESFNNTKTNIDREQLGLNHNDFILIFSGRIIPEKGIIPLIQAMRLLKELTNIKLLILGSSALGDSRNKTSFLEEVQRESHNLKNIIFTGFIEYTKIGQYLQMADVAVLPSTWDEPFGLTCVEALAAGLPLITTKRGGIPEIADDSCAILLDCNNFLAQKIADAIIMLYNDPEKRLRMSKASLIRSKSFNQDIYAQNIFQVLSNI